MHIWSKFLLKTLATLLFISGSSFADECIYLVNPRSEAAPAHPSFILGGRLVVAQNGKWQMLHRELGGGYESNNEMCDACYDKYRSIPHSERIVEMYKYGVISSDAPTLVSRGVPVDLDTMLVAAIITTSENNQIMCGRWTEPSTYIPGDAGL